MRSFLLAGALLAVSSSATAQPTSSKPVSPQFTAEYQAGQDAFNLGHLDEARAHFEKAKAFEPTLPGPHRFLAAVDQAESKFADCVTHAREAIQLNPQSKELPDTIKLHDACRASLGKPAFTFAADSTGGAIAVTANVSDASVTLNGLKYGATPLAPREVAPGDAEIVVAKTGYLPQTVKTAILPGIVTDIDVTLAVDPNAKIDNGLGGGKPVIPTTGYLLVSTAAGATITFDGKPTTIGAQGLETDPGEHEIEVRAPGMEPWRRRVRIARGQKTSITPVLTSSDDRNSSHTMGVLFAAIGTALAAGGAGAGMYSYRQAEIAHDWLREEQTRPSTVPLSVSSQALPVHTRADIDTQNNKAKTWGYVSDAAFGAAAISIGIGAYYLLKHRPEERAGQPPPFAIAPIVAPGETGVVVAKEVRW